MKLLKLLVAVLAASALVATSANAGEVYGPNSRYEQAVHKGLCPVNLYCSGVVNGVRTSVHSTPGHQVRLPREELGPPFYKVLPGDTLWSIAKYYLGSGKGWTLLCTEQMDHPSRLKVGDTVSFC